MIKKVISTHISLEDYVFLSCLCEEKETTVYAFVKEIINKELDKYKETLKDIEVDEDIDLLK